MSSANNLDEKFDSLIKYLKTFKSLAVAYSSGVDSTFLLKAAHIALGDKVVALTAKSPLFPKRELDESIEFCKVLGVRHIIIDIDISKFAHNPSDRCYICKYEIFSRFSDAAREIGIDAILEGSNLDDENDYRPGIRAIRELGIISPLKLLGFTKPEIREYSRKLDLKTTKKPSFACLASRFPYGEALTPDKLFSVEKAEEFLFACGFKQFRVRIHNDVARIEVLEDEFEKVLKLKNQIVTEFKAYGFKYVSLDLDGYRTGSMNEVLNTAKSRDIQ